MNIKSKFNSALYAGYALASLLVVSAGAQEVTSKLENVSAISLDRMELTNNGTAYVVAVGITFQNLNPEAIKFRDADLDLELNSLRPDGTNSVVDLGPAHLDEVVLPGGSTAAPGTVSVTANIILGPTNDSTNLKLVQLFNAVSDPANKVALKLAGASQLGLQMPHGWVFEQGKRFEVELTFAPTIQRKVLLN